MEKEKIAVQTKKICEINGNGAISERIVCKWFIRFKSENFDLEDWDYSGRPIIVDMNKSKIILVTQHEALQNYSTYLR